ncbi:MAG: hypothetical protein A3J74_04150 [Elusimicrobia bacterium RIFCSPHIGHO2_02_FULL_57_9]|nr:MAG: hypothetical protein A3J74_04150 [Elusimicrobia bacterium RIFCSPHIGHO2_02_FULL_57_9]
MAFRRRETVIETTDLNTISPEEAEKRIIAGVKKYATNETNWGKADANTPYLGHIIGIGIESSNLADITMSIERQFLTRKTTRVPVTGDSTEFRLEDGELGKLRILDGQDALAATPGLSIKMLMDLGHMPQNLPYLDKVVSFAYITAVGDGYRMNDALQKVLAKVGKFTGAERKEAVANLKAMAEQTKAYEALLADPAALAAARKKTYDNDKAAYDTLARELNVVHDKLKGLTSSNDPAAIARLRAEEAEVKTRLRMSAAKLRVSQEVANAAGRRSPVEEAQVQQIRKLLAQSVRLAASHGA